ncbi:MAG: hypothetical protein COB62_05675 [Piscirickettsiaceae bacterium]|nr:MAG: hypothetical protein COB62_05675 [Piscirickettsiaceae bacterium]
MKRLQNDAWLKFIFIGVYLGYKLTKAYLELNSTSFVETQAGRVVMNLCPALRAFVDNAEHLPRFYTE